MEKIITWVKANILLAVGLLLAVVILFFGKPLKRILFGTRRIKHRRKYLVQKGRTVTRSRRRTIGRPLPRSVGTGTKGYPAAGGGYIPFVRNKDGSIKKAQFVGGTLAAKRRMAQLRKNR